MNIVILDGYTINPGDLSWGCLEKHGDLTVYDRTNATQIIERAERADIILTNKTPLDQSTLSRLPKLKYIGVLATGYNVVDTTAALEKGIPVCNVPAYSSRSVAQMVFAHILNFTQNVKAHSDSVQKGKWSKCDDFCYWEHPLTELSDLTLGIVGLGEIGKMVASIGQAFGMKILACSRNMNKRAPQGVQWCDIKTLFHESDFISLHCPLTTKTHQLINDERIAWMKSSAFLINTGRGGLINEDALASALRSGKLAGAGLDVLENEPPRESSALININNCFITPHIAWATKAARQRLLDITSSNLQSFLEGCPDNKVN